MDGKYPWLDKDEERINLTDRQKLEKYIDLENFGLSNREKKELMDILYKYKDAFNLRDEIYTFPSIGAEIHVTDKFPFYRPYYVKEDKTVLEKRNEKVMLLSISFTKRYLLSVRKL